MNRSKRQRRCSSAKHQLTTSDRPSSLKSSNRITKNLLSFLPDDVLLNILHIVGWLSFPESTWKREWKRIINVPTKYWSEIHRSIPVINKHWEFLICKEEKRIMGCIKAINQHLWPFMNKTVIPLLRFLDHCRLDFTVTVCTLEAPHPTANLLDLSVCCIWLTDVLKAITDYRKHCELFGIDYSTLSRRIIAAASSKEKSTEETQPIKIWLLEYPHPASIEKIIDVEYNRICRYLYATPPVILQHPNKLSPKKLFNAVILFNFIGRRIIYDLSKYNGIFEKSTNLIRRVFLQCSTNSAMVWFHRDDYETSSDAYKVLRSAFNTETDAEYFLRKAVKSIYNKCLQRRLLLPCTEPYRLMDHYYNDNWIQVDKVNKELGMVYDCANTDHLVLYESLQTAWPHIDLNSVKELSCHGSGVDGKQELILPFRINLIA
jgi:hypothetical protein